MSREFIAKPLLWWCFVPQSNPKINVAEGNNMFIEYIVRAEILFIVIPFLISKEKWCLWKIWVIFCLT